LATSLGSVFALGYAFSHHSRSFSNGGLVSASVECSNSKLFLQFVDGDPGLVENTAQCSDVDVAVIWDGDTSSILFQPDVTAALPEERRSPSAAETA